MKLAILMLCHRDGKQINSFIETLNNNDISFFIHVDAKSNIDKEINVKDHVYILPKDMRHNVEWATFSQIAATYELLSFSKTIGQYDYYCLVSGQDFPIKSSESLLNFLKENKGISFLNLFDSYNSTGTKNNHDKNNEIAYPAWIMSRKGVGRVLRRLWVAISGGYNHTYKLFMRKNTTGMKFYFGSQWWCLHGAFVEWAMDYIENNTNYYEYFKLCSTPDESFFHTLFMNSPYKDYKKDYLHYIDWSEGKSSPKCFSAEDFDVITKSGKYFVRKIQSDEVLISMLQNKIKKEEHIR